VRNGAFAGEQSLRDDPTHATEREPLITRACGNRCDRRNCRRF
jgi:hypothetical protein